MESLKKELANVSITRFNDEQLSEKLEEHGWVVTAAFNRITGESDEDDASDAAKGPPPCDWFTHRQMTDILLCPIRPPGEKRQNPCTFVLRSKAIPDEELASGQPIIDFNEAIQRVIIEK